MAETKNEETKTAEVEAVKPTPKPVVKKVAEVKPVEVKKITSEDIQANPAIQKMTEGGKIVATESLPESDVVYYLARKDGAWSIVAGYGVNGIMYSESEPIKSDPDLIKQQSFSAQSLDRTGQANIQYTVNWMAQRVRSEIALKLGKKSGPSITFTI